MVNHNTLRTCESYQSLSENFRFVTAVDLNKGLEEIELPILLNRCAPISELPSMVTWMSPWQKFGT